MFRLLLYKQQRKAPKITMKISYVTKTIYNFLINFIFLFAKHLPFHCSSQIALILAQQQLDVSLNSELKM